MRLYSLGGRYCSLDLALRRFRVDGNLTYCSIAIVNRAIGYEDCGNLVLNFVTFKHVPAWADSAKRQAFLTDCLKRAAFECFQPDEAAIVVKTVRLLPDYPNGTDAFYKALGTFDRSGSFAEELCRAYCLGELDVFGRLPLELLESVFAEVFLNPEEE